MHGSSTQFYTLWQCLTVQYSFCLQDKVKITPYSESASETANYNVSIVPTMVKPRVLDESVFLSASEPSTTTEPDTVCASYLYVLFLIAVTLFPFSIEITVNEYDSSIRSSKIIIS